MPTTYIATGSVCGDCGHQHGTAVEAQQCADGHHQGIRRANPSTFPTRAYSDRRVRAIEDGRERGLTEQETEQVAAYYDSLG